MATNIIDTHAHLDMPEFDADREEVIQRAKDSGIIKIITIGIDLPSDQKAIDLANSHPDIWAAIGIHPQESKGVQKSQIDQLAELVKSPRVVAIGELGLDYYRDYSPREDQAAVLEWQLELAKKVGLPIIIHCRQAQQDMIPILRNWCRAYPLSDDKPRGVVHCFSGDRETAESYMEMGLYISLGGYIGYPSSAKLRETIKELPLNRLVLETDCPFLPPQKLRGKRNEPAYTQITLGVLAETQGLPPEVVAQQTTLNAMKVFKLE